MTTPLGELDVTARGGRRASVTRRTRETEVTVLLADLGSPERAAAAAEALLRRGLVPRTFPFGHPLASYLRVTVRDGAENDRLIRAARSAGAKEPVA